MRSPALRLRFREDEAREHRDLVSAALLDFDTAAVHEISDREWRVFFRTRDERDRATVALGSSCEAEPLDVEDEDWARKSQQDLKAVTVGRLVIAPPWDASWPSPSGAEHLIIIEPSTGFGTGHHATTRLCLRALQELDLHGKRVLDVGTGSGVLAIAAAKLGAATVIAVDNDPDAIAAAEVNVRRNSVNVDLRVVDLEHAKLDAADLVTANLTGAMLRRAADLLASLARPGVLIVSGLLDEECEAVEAAFAPHASSVQRAAESGWSSLTIGVARQPPVTSPSSAPGAR